MIVQPNQSLLDVILQGCGSMQAAMQVAADNGVALSYMPLVGSSVQISGAAVALGDAGTLQYLLQNSIVIGTRGPVTDPLITEDGDDPLLSEDGGSELVPE
jgi:hypothetical protein